MTDAEKDREAVERGQEMVQLGGYATDRMTRFFALAREALEMRERGPVAWRCDWIRRGKWMQGTPTPIRENARDQAADWREVGCTARIVPLYAGTPEEVPND